MTSAVSLRVQCPICGAWGQLQLDYPTDRAVADDGRDPEIVGFACPNQNRDGHDTPAHEALRALIPDDLDPVDRVN